MAKKSKKNDSFIPGGADGPHSFGGPKMKGKNSKAPAGNAGSSKSISGSPEVLKKVNSRNVFKSGHRG